MITVLNCLCIVNAGRLLDGKRYGRWVKGRVGGCGELGVGVCKLHSDF